MDEEEEVETIGLKVKASKIDAVDSGIARVHSDYLKDIDLGERNLINLKSEEGSSQDRFEGEEAEVESPRDQGGHGGNQTSKVNGGLREGYRVIPG